MPSLPIGTSFIASPEERAQLMGIDRAMGIAKNSYDEILIQFHLAEANLALAKDVLEHSQDLLNEKLEEIKKAHGALPGENWQFGAGNVTFIKVADAKS